MERKLKDVMGRMNNDFNTAWVDKVHEFHLSREIYDILFRLGEEDITLEEAKAEMISVVQQREKQYQRACYAIYHLDDNGETDSMNVYCSVECRQTAFPLPEAMSGDYDHLLQIIMNHFEVS